MQRLRTTRCSHGLSSTGRRSSRSRAVRPHEHFLDDALGVAPIARVRPRRRLQAPPVAIVDRLEGVLAPGAEERDEMLVGAQSEGGGRHLRSLLAQVAGGDPAMPLVMAVCVSVHVALGRLVALDVDRLVAEERADDEVSGALALDVGGLLADVAHPGGSSSAGSPTS